MSKLNIFDYWRWELNALGAASMMSLQGLSVPVYKVLEQWGGPDSVFGLVDSLYEYEWFESFARSFPEVWRAVVRYMQGGGFLFTARDALEDSVLGDVLRLLRKTQDGLLAAQMLVPFIATFVTGNAVRTVCRGRGPPIVDALRGAVFFVAVAATCADLTNAFDRQLLDLSVLVPLTATAIAINSAVFCSSLW